MAQKMMLALLLPLLLAGGEHFSGKAEPFPLRDCAVAVKAPEFREAAGTFAGLLGKVLKRNVPVGENGNIYILFPKNLKTKYDKIISLASVERAPF